MERYFELLERVGMEIVGSNYEDEQDDHGGFLGNPQQLLIASVVRLRQEEDRSDKTVLTFIPAEMRRMALPKV